MLTFSAQYVGQSEIRPAKQTRAPAQLDRTDIRIIRELLQGQATLTLDPDFRKSFRKIARSIKLDEDTVRNRAKRLEKIGFLGEWRILLNPHILGLTEKALWFDVPSSVSKKELIARVKLVSGVFMIVDYYGSLLGLILRHESLQSMQKTISLVRTLSKTENMVLVDSPWPVCRLVLSKADWMIIGSLHHSPRKSYVGISNDLGISSRTVTRRLRRMTKEGVLSALPAPNPKVLEGTIMADLLVGCLLKDKREVGQKMTSKLNDYMWHVYQTVSPGEDSIQYCCFNLALPSISKAQEIIDWAKDQTGVRYARIEFQEDHMVLFDVVDDHLERKLAQIEC